MTKTEFLKQMRDLIRMYEEEASNQLRYKEEQINKWIEAREQERKQKEQSSDPT